MIHSAFCFSMANLALGQISTIKWYLFNYDLL